jgi:hypothetical protein
LPSGVQKTERRRKERAPGEIKSLDDARQLVENIGSRNVENNPKVKAWRFAKQTAWLLILVVAFLVYYLVDAIYTALTLP